MATGMAIILVVLACGIVPAGEVSQAVRRGTAVLPARDSGVGERLTDIGFTTSTAGRASCQNWRSGRTIVICMTSGSCPVAQNMHRRWSNCRKLTRISRSPLSPSTWRRIHPEKAKLAGADLRKAEWQGIFRRQRREDRGRWRRQHNGSFRVGSGAHAGLSRCNR